jgi:hypothetical protein
MRVPWRLLAALTLSSCATAPTISEPGAPAPMPGTINAAAPSPAIFATELAGPATFLPPLPTAVVILKPEDMARNRAFCEAAMHLPTVKQAEAASVVAPNLIHTKWLVQLGEVPPDHAQDCDFLVGTYDYARAARVISAIHTTEGGFFGRGPYLLMIIPDRAGLHVAGLNGSAYPDTDMNAFISKWGRALNESQAQITTTPDRPGLIRSVFNLVRAILTTATSGANGLVTGVFEGL